MRKPRERTPLPGRRRRALKHLAIALAVMLVVNQVTCMGLLLPIQALWKVEEREGVRGRIVTCRWDPRIHRTDLFFLTENEDMVFLGNTYLTFLGWNPGFGWAVDCTGDQPLYAGEDASSREGYGRVWYFYGRVDDPAIETVEISLRAVTGWDKARQENVYQERSRLTARRADFLEREGRRYFLLDCRLEDWPEDSGVHAFALGLDGSGKVITERAIDEGIHSSFG